MTEAITLAATPAAVLALVELAKRLGLPARGALVLAVVLGVGLAVSDHLWGGVPLYGAAVQGLILGLGAAGLYDLAGRLRPAEPDQMVVYEAIPGEPFAGEDD